MTMILMLDIETLGQGHDAVVWQTALYAVDSDDPETLLELPHFQYVPIQPQLDLFPARRIDASTMLFWMREVAKQPTIADEIEACDSNDFEELPSVLRHLVRAFNRYTLDGTAPYELWTRGNFDVPILDSLLRQCGLTAPWEFRRVHDLRTLELVSGVNYKDVPTPDGYIKHRADWDAKFQLTHWAACQRALGVSK
jgi:hypothetical protein